MFESFRYISRDGATSDKRSAISIYWDSVTLSEYPACYFIPSLRWPSMVLGFIIYLFREL